MTEQVKASSTRVRCVCGSEYEGDRVYVEHWEQVHRSTCMAAMAQDSKRDPELVQAQADEAFWRNVFHEDHGHDAAANYQGSRMRCQVCRTFYRDRLEEQTRERNRQMLAALREELEGTDD